MCFHNLRIHTKITLCFLAVLIIIFLVLSVAINSYFSWNTTILANSTTFRDIQQVNRSIEFQINNTMSIIDLVSRDLDVLEFLSWDYNHNDAESLLTKSKVRSLISDVTDTYNGIEGIAIVGSYNYYISNEMYSLSYTPLIDDDWFKNCMNSKKITVSRYDNSRQLVYYNSPGADKLITISKPIYLPNSSRPAGAILVDYNVNFIDNLVNQSSLSRSDFVYISDENGQPIYSPSHFIVPRIRLSWFGNSEQNIFQKTIQGNRYVFMYEVSSLTNWKTIGVFSLDQTLQPIKNFRKYLIIFMAVSGFLAFGLVTFISGSIVRPLTKLNKLVQGASQGDFKVRFNSKYNDEIGQLGTSFNKMVVDLEDLISQVYIEQRQKRKAELQVLQEQIKPHFLYNTFDTIHWLAKKYKAEPIVEIIMALTRFFRYGLSGGKDLIAVEDELQHAINYLIIQKVRYGDKLSYLINISPEVKKYSVHKLILQPFIENSLYHGIKLTKRQGVIHILVKIKEDKLILSVVDNGAGMSEDKCEEIRKYLSSEGLEKRTSYGIFNVNERIRISYGNEYGVSISSKEGHYTRVDIIHPLIESKEVNEYE